MKNECNLFEHVFKGHVIILQFFSTLYIKKDEKIGIVYKLTSGCQVLDTLYMDWFLVLCFWVPIFNQCLPYRIFTRISRDILDKIWTKFSQFDLNPGHKHMIPIKPKWNDQCLKAFVILKFKKLWMLDHFCKYVLIRLIREHIRLLPYLFLSKLWKICSYICWGCNLCSR